MLFNGDSCLAPGPRVPRFMIRIVAALAVFGAFLYWSEVAQPQELRLAVTDIVGLEELQTEYGAFQRIAVVPAALPSFVASSLYSLEKATRSSVILGIVGAGGIGIELKVAMDLFRYDHAATAILAIFALVIVVEQLSGAVRRKLI